MNLTRSITQLTAVVGLALAATPAWAEAITLDPTDIGQSWDFIQLIGAAIVLVCIYLADRAKTAPVSQ